MHESDEFVLSPSVSVSSSSLHEVEFGKQMLAFEVLPV